MNLPRRVLRAVSRLMLHGALLVTGSPLVSAAPVQTGQPLPTLRGSLLSGGAIELPAATRGREALLLFGFSYESRHDVEAWAKSFRRDFAADSARMFFEIPVIGGAGRLARPFIERGMRRGTPPELHDRVITVYRDAGQWKRDLVVRDPDIAYLVVVDREGRVMWRGTGPFSEAAYRELNEQLRERR